VNLGGLYDYDELGRQDALIADAVVARGVRTGAEFVFVRKSADLKAVDVAELFSVQPETVWRWEHDETEISAHRRVCARPALQAPQVDATELRVPRLVNRHAL